MSVKAVIDVGTNSVKLLVMKIENGRKEVLKDTLEITRLGEGLVEKGELAAAAMERTAAVLAVMKKAADEFGAEEIRAVGTQALRTAANSEEFTRAVRDRTGLEIKVISGRQEAEYTFAAALASVDTYDNSNICMFDIGGGSTEIVIGNPNGIVRGNSFPVGALVLFRDFFAQSVDAPVSTDLLLSASKSVTDRLGGLADYAIDSLMPAVAVGGTFNTLGVVAANRSGGVRKRQLTFDEISEQIELYASMSVSERQAIKGLDPKRADIILPGALIARELLSLTDHTEITLSEHGLRYGVMADLLGRSFD